MSTLTSQILYTAVMRNKSVILSDYALAKGNYLQVMQTVVSKVEGSNVKRSFQVDRYGFHVLTDDIYLFLLMTDSDFKLRVAFACLDDLKTQFYNQFTQLQRQNAIAYALQNDFTKVLQQKGIFKQFKVQRQKVDYYNSPESDKITQVKQGLEYTKNIMMENLDKLLERGEKLDILVQKTEHMTTVSTDMKKHATSIRRNMWWRDKKIMLLLVLVLLLIIYIGMVIGCGGFKMQKCF